MPEPARERRLSDSAAPVAPLVGAKSFGEGKLPLLLGVIVLVDVLDYITKLLIVRSFHLGRQVEIIGDYVKLTYIQNTGAAFGLHAGDMDRIVFLVLPMLALLGLIALYWATSAGERARLLAIALISAGAIGNLIDRVRSSSGVVDFIDIGYGNHRWPVFNVADIAVTTGAVLLALSLWSEERGHGRAT